ncbi:hypothetical protein PUNSTDRAFT_140528 [Punctularia strigosozonata HHB-11173 SS5]|uniref:uncharacterized protein n=1 Tax=Punctularia strigosozonata (strain HHB-11173) TaxID=741275 RepID=UPI0004416FD5|nr:uncharacterized protein PUNSTDRAFT_140528 [Punctularia strigosozonata HHB-11173 SS5]EIN14176.1 hypothetical protein PUNSTDRAFT_140528 [Punctularia strigosozonata HHB-11173 SS5]
MSSTDENAINYSSPSVDWRAKYVEISDILAETRQELDEFHQSSKELEEELERDLERAEKAQQDLKIKVARAEQERDDWKTKFMSLQTTHNTTTTSLQRELDMVRQENSKMRVQLRDLELGNDDLERNERAISSSLADVDAKYQRALEEKILLEHELLDKASMEEECQRLKDQVREANEEISILKDQLDAARAAASSRSSVVLSETSSASSAAAQKDVPLTTDDLMRTAPPNELSLEDLMTSSDTPTRKVEPTTNIVTPSESRKGQSALLRRTGVGASRSGIPSPGSSPSPFGRSSTLPSLNTALSSARYKASPRTPVARPTFPTRTTSVSSNATTSTATGIPRSKGVQMVSEMRARVKNLEQRIHTRVPRLRMGSVSGRQNAVPAATSTTTPTQVPASSSTTTVRPSPPSSRQMNRLSLDAEGEGKKTPAGGDTGWVLIMEDSPSPVKDRTKERRRTSSPTAPSAFKRLTSNTTSASNDRSISSQLQKSVNRRSGSRISVTTDRSSISTAASMSTIPTPTSRPTTPTFLPLPTSGLYSNPGVGLKRSTGPSSTTLKRSSLGSSSPFPPTSLRPPSSSGFYTRTSSNTTTTNSHSSDGVSNDLSDGPHHNVTTRAKANPLSQSRIGRPNAGRKSAGQEALDAYAALDNSRTRASPTATRPAK